MLFPGTYAGGICLIVVERRTGVRGGTPKS